MDLNEAYKVMDFKYTKNKHLSKHISAKNARKYIGGKNKRKYNYNKDHFEKSSIKKNQINDSICNYDGKKTALIRLQNNIKLRQVGSCNVTDVVDNRISFYSPIHNPLNYLWSLKKDHLLGKHMKLTYWNSNPVRLQGTLVCVSNSGQFKLGHIAYYSSKTYEKNHLNVTTDSYWFHVNCIKSIYIINKNEEEDITNLFIDMVKIKLLNYFLFICSFKTDSDDNVNINTSPLKYLLSMDLDRKHKMILKDFKDSDILHCPFAAKMSSQFIYGKKQNDFEYLEKTDWKEYPAYFRHEQLLTLLCSYKNSLIEYIENTEKEQQKINRKMDDKIHEINTDNDEQLFQLTYMHWDRINVSKQMKEIQKENRTV